ncbi:hypothetical protein [Streptomyces longwoodensis]|uniref:hypothetical protein n=1 Tax=Streptomyces longwoodensis TaxID=68231 RepID=UPI0033CD866C
MPECGETPVHDEEQEWERAREERVEAYYDGWSACGMAERIVELEDEIGADVDGICTGMHADVAEAQSAWADERLRADRFEAAWLSARRRAFMTRLRLDLAERSRVRRTSWLARAIKQAGDYRRQRDRYRLAWLSARRRAVDEANMGMEALDVVRRDRDRWRQGHERAEAQLVYERRDNERLRAELEAVRESTRASRLEFAGEDEGGQVYRLAP